MIHHHTQLMTNIEELDAKKMEVLKEVASMNVKIGEGRATLIKLEKDKEDFIVLRESEVGGRIAKLVNGSRTLLSEVKSNYDQVHAFYQTVSAFSTSLAQAQESFSGQIADYKVKSALYEAKLAEQENSLSEQRIALKLQSESLERDREYLKKVDADLTKEKQHLEARQRGLKIALELLKEKNG